MYGIIGGRFQLNKQNFCWNDCIIILHILWRGSKDLESQEDLKKLKLAVTSPLALRISDFEKSDIPIYIVYLIMLVIDHVMAIYIYIYMYKHVFYINTYTYRHIHIYNVALMSVMQQKKNLNRRFST